MLAFKTVAKYQVKIRYNDALLDLQNASSWTIARLSGIADYKITETNQTGALCIEQIKINTMLGLVYIHYTVCIAIRNEDSV